MNFLVPLNSLNNVELIPVSHRFYLLPSASTQSLDMPVMHSWILGAQMHLRRSELRQFCFLLSLQLCLSVVGLLCVSALLSITNKYK